MQGVIEKFDVAEFSIIFRVDHYLEEYASRADPVMKSPYYFAAMQILLAVARNTEKFGFERQPVDFIFDIQVKEQATLIAAFQWAREVAHPDPPDLYTSIIRSAPAFRDDEDVLPLQAADMHATKVRMDMESPNPSGIEPLPGTTKQIRGMYLTFTRAQFRKLIERDVAFWQSRGLA